MYKRYLKMSLESNMSAFLWGARKTGKSTFLKNLYPKSKFFDLLDTKMILRYSAEPWRLREEILALSKDQLKRPIIIDEVQKVPAILDEVHYLIENHRCQFILCGSSARKMRNVGVNLLGGRALKYNFFPLTYQEIKKDFDLIKIFNNGAIPSHYSMKNAKHILNSYIEDYLTSEIKSEGLVRNLGAFNRFLYSIGFSHGEMVNYSNIAREVGIDSTTVKEYYQILEDTLVGHFLPPFAKKANRRIISSIPKFYLFDVGVANRLLEREFKDLSGIEAGRSFEHYIFLECNSYINLNLLDYKLSYWRTHTGLEVDLVAHNKKGDIIPIEIKITSDIKKNHLGGIKAFMNEHGVSSGYVVCMEENARKIISDSYEITILPVKDFLVKLWDGDIINE